MKLFYLTISLIGFAIAGCSSTKRNPTMCNQVYDATEITDFLIEELGDNEMKYKIVANEDLRTVFTEMMRDKAFYSELQYDSEFFDRHETDLRIRKIEEGSARLLYGSKKGEQIYLYLNLEANNSVAKDYPLSDPQHDSLLCYNYFYISYRNNEITSWTNGDVTRWRLEDWRCRNEDS